MNLKNGKQRERERERERETGERRAEMRCGGGDLRDDGAHDGEEKVTED